MRETSLFSLGSETSDSLSGAPDFLGTDLIEFLFKCFSVVFPSTEFQGPLGLAAILDGVIQIVEHGLLSVLYAALEGDLESIFEFGGPVQGSTSSGGGASFVHPIHTICTDERVQTLSSLLDCLIERFRGRMSTFSQNFILRKEHSLNATHETSSLTVQVTVDFFLEGRLVEISGTDTDTESDGFFLGFAGDVLEDGEGRVDASAFFEETADCATGTLGGTENDVDVGGRDDTGQILIDDGETVREVQGLMSIGNLR